MNQKIGLLVGISVLTSTLLVGGAVTAFAQTAATAPEGVRGGERGSGMMGNRAPGVFGTVTAISGSTITITSKMPIRGVTPGSAATTGAATTYTINASGATVTKSGATSALASIAIGDTVMAQGTVSGTSVTATAIRDGVMMGGGRGFGERASTTASSSANTALVQGNGQPVIGGAVTAISGNTLTITNKSNVTYTVDVTSAKIVKSGAVTVASSVVVGDNVIVQGTVNGSSVSAASVIDQGTVPTTTTATGNPPASTSHGFMGAIGGFFHKLFGFF